MLDERQKSFEKIFEGEQELNEKAHIPSLIAWLMIRNEKKKIEGGYNNVACIY